MLVWPSNALTFYCQYIGYGLFYSVLYVFICLCVFGSLNKINSDYVVKC